MDRANRCSHTAPCLPMVIESVFLCLTSHFRDPRVAHSNMREVIQPIGLTVMSVCFKPSISFQLSLSYSVILNTQCTFAKKKWSFFILTNVCMQNDFPVVVDTLDSGLGLMCLS